MGKGVDISFLDLFFFISLVLFYLTGMSIVAAQQATRTHTSNQYGSLPTNLFSLNGNPEKFLFRFLKREH